MGSRRVRDKMRDKGQMLEKESEVERRGMCGGHVWQSKEEQILGKVKRKTENRIGTMDK